MTKTTYAVLSPGQPIQLLEMDEPVPFDTFADQVGYPMQVLKIGATDDLSAASMVARTVSTPFFPEALRADNPHASDLTGQPIKGTVVVAGPVDQLGQRLTGLTPEWIDHLMNRPWSQP